MAIGICITHKIADAAFITTFIRSWSALARGEADDPVARPEFAAPNFYPPANESFKIPVDKDANNRNIITKRFVFVASKLEELRTKAVASADSVARPTRVESVTALLWKGFVAAASTKTNLKVLIQPVNLRNKIPSLKSESLIGNIMFSSVVLSIVREGEVNLEESAIELRQKQEEFRYVIHNEDVSSSMIGSKLANMMFNNYSRLSYDTHEPYTVSSWRKLPHYEASFGWGTQVWVVGNVAPTFDNIAMLIDTKDGQGIEAFVTLPEENMLSFEQNQELLAFASLNPSVLV